MSKLEVVELPELPDNRRWRLTIDTLINSPKIVLEEKCWYGWRKIRDQHLSCDVYPTLPIAIINAADSIMCREKAVVESIDYLGTTKP